MLEGVRRVTPLLMSAVLRNRFVGCRGSGCQTAPLSSSIFYVLERAVKKSKIASTTDRVTYHTRCSVSSPMTGPGSDSIPSSATPEAMLFSEPGL